MITADTLNREILNWSQRHSWKPTCRTLRERPIFRDLLSTGKVRDNFEPCRITVESAGAVARTRSSREKDIAITFVKIVSVYHYIVAGDNFEPFDGEEQNGESSDADLVRQKGLERMAAGLRASQPGTEIGINPPGVRKVSDMIWLVAKPPLESAPDYEEKEMILKLATMPWNFTLLDPIDREEMLEGIANLFQCPEDMEVFYYLADRKAHLFPEEERVICKVETEAASYGDVTLRVAFAMEG